VAGVKLPDAHKNMKLPWNGSDFHENMARGLTDGILVSDEWKQRIFKSGATLWDFRKHHWIVCD